MVPVEKTVLPQCKENSKGRKLDSAPNTDDDGAAANLDVR